MTLNQFTSEQRTAIFGDLREGLEPRVGAFDGAALRGAKTKGHPQMGTVRFRPEEIAFEFIYPDPAGSSAILEVLVKPPERIVFLPVPDWVVENIWQGEVDGTYHFEGEAMRLLGDFQEQLTPEGNLKWFDKQPAKRRE